MERDDLGRVRSALMAALCVRGGSRGEIPIS
jgi:hypothetical protein